MESNLVAQAMGDESDEWIPAKYQHESIRGARLPGWENLNVVLLADDVGIGPQHCRQILTGRAEGRLWIYVRIAQHLELSVDEVLRLIESAATQDKERRRSRGASGYGLARR